jgi:tetratricopeptide (TPR) repeat protein
VDEVIVVRSGDWKAPEGVGVIQCDPTTHPELHALDDESGAHYLIDYAAARNMSFDAATCNYQLWLDSDDTVDGAEHLPKIVDAMFRADVPVMHFEYDYGRDERGNQVCYQQRERVMKRGVGVWQYPGHEVHITPPEYAVGFCSLVTVRHHKHEKPPRKVRDLNVKILSRVKDPDARICFHLGNEKMLDRPLEAEAHFLRCLELSTWNEERGAALVNLGKILEARGDLDEAKQRYAKALAEDRFNADGWFGLARVAYTRQQWQACVDHTERGFSTKPGPSILYSPFDRKATPHVFYSVALAQVGRTKDAIASCDAGLALFEDESLRSNKATLEGLLHV